MPTPFFIAKLTVRSVVVVGRYVAAATQISSPEFEAARAGCRSVNAVPGAQQPVPDGTGLTQRTVAKAAVVAARDRKIEALKNRAVTRIAGVPFFAGVTPHCLADRAEMTAVRSGRCARDAPSRRAKKGQVIGCAPKPDDRDAAAAALDLRKDSAALLSSAVGRRGVAAADGHSDSPDAPVAQSPRVDVFRRALRGSGPGGSADGDATNRGQRPARFAHLQRRDGAVPSARRGRRALFVRRGRRHRGPPRPRDRDRRTRRTTGPHRRDRSRKARRRTGRGVRLDAVPETAGLRRDGRASPPCPFGQGPVTSGNGSRRVANGPSYGNYCRKRGLRTGL